MSAIPSKHFIQSLPRLIKNPKRVFTDDRLLAETIPLLALLEPIGPLIISPVIVDLESRKKNADPEERKDNVFQEFLDQLTSTAVYLSSFLLGGQLAKRVLPILKPERFKMGSLALENAQTVISIATTILGDTFIRPFINTKIVTEKGNASKNTSSKAVWAVPQPRTTSLYPANWRQV